MATPDEIERLAGKLDFAYGASLGLNLTADEVLTLVEEIRKIAEALTRSDP